MIFGWSDLPITQIPEKTSWKFYCKNHDKSGKFAGIAIFGSGFFTALNNGLISAVISFLRTMVFETAAILILPPMLATGGIRFAIVFAELMATVVTVGFLLARRRKDRH